MQIGSSKYDKVLAPFVTGRITQDCEISSFSYGATSVKCKVSKRKEKVLDHLTID
jgi:hypothetical protein